MAAPVFIAVHRLSLVVEGDGYSPVAVRGLLLGGFSCSEHAFESAGWVFVVRGLSCSMACGIFLDQGSNLCPLHWPVNSQSLDHQENPLNRFFWCLNKLLSWNYTYSERFIVNSTSWWQLEKSWFKFCLTTCFLCYFQQVAQLFWCSVS